MPLLARPPGFRSWLQAGGYLIAGGAVSLGIAWALAATLSLDQGRTLHAEASVTGGYWMVTRIDRIGATLIHSTRNMAKRSWGPEQATGEPDTPNPGDQTTAWATASSDMGEQWLHLTYAEAITPAAVMVHENCAPGALIRIAAFKAGGDGVTLWTGTDPTPSAAQHGVSRIDVSVPFETRAIRIYLDTSKVAGWNEIDAVGVEDRAGRTHWAVAARASSIYGVTSDATLDVRTILPRWAPDETHRAAPPPAKAAVPVSEIDDRSLPPRGRTFDDPDESGDRAPVTQTASNASVSPADASSVGERFHAGFGFPMLAMAAHWDASTASLNAAALSPFAVSPAVGPSGPWTATTTTAPVLPYDPILLGLMVDAIVWAIVLRLLVLALTRPGRIVKEVLRMRRGGCIRCGYDLQYDFVKGCPECGWRRNQ